MICYIRESRCQALCIITRRASKLINARKFSWCGVVNFRSASHSLPFAYDKSLYKMTNDKIVLIPNACCTFIFAFFIGAHMYRSWNPSRCSQTSLKTPFIELLVPTLWAVIMSLHDHKEQNVYLDKRKMATGRRGCHFVEISCLVFFSDSDRDSRNWMWDGCIFQAGKHYNSKRNLWKKTTRGRSNTSLLWNPLLSTWKTSLDYVSQSALPALGT